MKTYVGIDPGKSGAIASLTINDDGGVEKVRYRRMTQDFNDLHNIIGKYCMEADAVWVEKVGHFNASRNHTIAFNFGVNVGLLMAALQLTETKFRDLTPARWHNLMSIKKFAGQGKERSLACARLHFPSVTFIPGGCHKPHDGCVEAALIAYAGWKEDRENGI